MKINKLIIKSSKKQMINTNELKKGNIIRGKIVEITNDFIKLDLGNGDYLTGKTQISLNKGKGDTINFLIKSIDQSKIILSPIPDEVVEEKKNEIYLNNLLKNLNMEINEKNMQVIKTLIKFSMPIQKSVIEYIKKNIDKIEGLLDIKESETIKLINNGNPFKNEITSLYKIDIKDELFLSLKQNGLNENKEIDMLDKQNTSKLIHELKSIIKDNKIDIDTIERIAFLIKTGLKVSINNLKHITSITEGNWFIEKDMEELLELLKNDSSILKKLTISFRSLPFSFDFKSDSDSIKQIIKKYYKNINDDIKEIKEELKNVSKIETSILEKIEKLEDKMYFLSRLNESNTFIYIPFLYQPLDLKEKLFLLNKTKKGNGDRITIYMSLNTKNLKNVEVLCNIIGESINLNFNLEEKEIMSFLQNNGKRLREALCKCGFDNITIKFGLKEVETKILQLLSDNNFITNSLDIRV